jgi:hypothetical protein
VVTASLSDNDFRVLADLMAGPHGRPVSSGDPARLLVVFSCADAEVGRAAARLYAEGLVRHVVFSGGIGKDSGGLAASGISEAAFLASVAIADGLPPTAVTLEESARNGRENAVRSLTLAAEKHLVGDGDRVAGLAPAQRSRRLFEELRFQAAALGCPGVVDAGFASGTIDPVAADIRAELLGELRGLHEMHDRSPQRIFRLDEFQPGGAHFDLVRRAGLG